MKDPFKLPEKIIQDYKSSGIIGLGEGHGIRENYEIYEEIINQLPDRPNIAVEYGYFDKIAFEKFRNGENFDSTYINSDGRINLENFIFLKKYLDNNPNVRVVFLDENLKNTEPRKERDEQMSEEFLRNFKKPFIIITGNIHVRKDIIFYDNRQIIPMGYFIKEKLGDFPVINVRAASGTVYYNKPREISYDKSSLEKVGKFLELGNNTYDYYFQKATPTTTLY